jgi:hypothetical protein
MKVCKYCEQEFEWAYDEDRKRWVPLVPLEKTEGHTRDYVDANGRLRSTHRQVCTKKGGDALTVTKLDRPIPAEMADNHEVAISNSRRRRGSKPKINPKQETMNT